MKSISVTKAEITVQFDRSEIDFLCNAINETREALEDWEFETRTGVSRERASSILDELRRIADVLPED